MEISAKAEYAVRAMLQLTEAADDSLVSAAVLAEAQGLPRKFLEAILLDLRRAGLVRSVRGPRGGYQLARPATEIAVGDVLRAVDGPLAEVRGRRPQDTTYDGVAQHLPTLWVAVRASLRGVLDATSLEQLRSGNLPDAARSLSESPDAWENR
ncbi:transcriptional regulator, BadM/Rrf2 family [Ruaniaceae bacterium KH17]|nr:transcriptional regulator, BadM/Rrf2 family [Ruaniaceae bacterium KH17]